MSSLLPARAGLVRRLPIAAALVGAAVSAQAQAPTNWQASPSSAANWFDGTHWSAGVPSTSHTAIVDNGGTTEIAGGTAEADGVRLGMSNSGHLLQTGGSLDIDDGHLTIAQGVGSLGSYTMQDGSLTIYRGFNLGLQGSGQFDQNGGQVTLTDQAMRFGNTASGIGIYNLRAGSFRVLRELSIGGRGTGALVQSGGTSEIATLRMAELEDSHAQYVLEQGTLTTTTSVVGLFGHAEFIHSGGTHTADRLTMGQDGVAPQSARYVLSGVGAELTARIELIGDFAGAAFEQSAGTNRVTGFLRVGSGAGHTASYSLSGGALTAPEESLGINGVGNFIQSGGTNTVSADLHVGYGSSVTASSGRYELSAGSLEVGGNEYVGYRAGHGGVGYFEQIGGTHSITGDLIIADDDAGLGEFRIENGSLAVGGNLVLGDANRSVKRFSVVGGLSQIDVEGSFSMGPALATRPETTAVIESIIDQTGLSTITLGGSAMLDGRLRVEFSGGFIPALGQQFVVLTAEEGVAGSLALIGHNADIFDLQITPNAVILVSLVPEPSAVVLGGSGLAAMLLVAYRRRSRRGRRLNNVGLPSP
ncbi:MAG: hypothetical protein DWQ37_05055 [Planctomycetota bacterium]|nr:MAG: hypothetical protein DWQ37_05055 [Planctomycetota bacterium]